jgi:hypothetical protein
MPPRDAQQSRITTGPRRRFGVDASVPAIHPRTPARDEPRARVRTGLCFRFPSRMREPARASSETPDARPVRPRSQQLRELPQPQRKEGRADPLGGRGPQCRVSWIGALRVYEAAAVPVRRKEQRTGRARSPSECRVAERRIARIPRLHEFAKGASNGTCAAACAAPQSRPARPAGPGAATSGGRWGSGHRALDHRTGRFSRGLGHPAGHFLAAGSPHVS